MDGLQQETSYREPHNFNESLAGSHAADKLPIWEEIYRAAFPTMIGMHNHRRDGEHQRQGVDRSVVLENGKQLWIDEKVRWKNKITGRVYEDIALEFLSDRDRNTPGWVCKPLLIDYICYAIAPLGRGYLLPLLQLQEAWRRNGDLWLKEYKSIKAENKRGDHRWTTLSCPVPVTVLYREMGAALRAQFTAIDGEEE